jgi:hypothetical protein
LEDKGVTETKKSSFCIQRINKIEKLQASETMAANKVASKSTRYRHSGNQSSSTSFKVQATLQVRAFLFV